MQTFIQSILNIVEMIIMMVNLRDKDNLQTKDREPVPNVSFVRRFDCIYTYTWPGSAVAIIHCCAGV
jgi:hypothetical protein